MADVVFRSAPIPQAPPGPPLPEEPHSNETVTSGETDSEPIEIREQDGGSVVLDALNITDKLIVLPEGDKEKVHDVKEYVVKIMKSKGLGETVHGFKKTLDEVKTEMGLDQEAEPSIVLDRISGVVRAWKNLSFISDPQVKKQIFFKLANMKSSSDMNKEVYRLMNQYNVWE